MEPPTRTITLEEHATFPSLGDSHPFYNKIWPLFPHVRAALLDHSTGRLADMDQGHVTHQVLSHLPGLANHNVAGCRGANDEMAAAIRAHPDRFAGFAALPMAHPDDAAAELERAVTQLGFKGAMIDNHLDDMTHYDDERFWPVFATAQRLDVPLYIHPAPCPDDTVKARFAGNYADVTATSLSMGAWGWHENIGLHILKLCAAGLFDRFPQLKIIIGHMGEMLPIWIDRIMGLKFVNRAGLKSFEDIWNNNIWITSSSFFSVRTLEMVLKTTRIDRLLYSVDAPFLQSEEGWNFLQEIAKGGVLSAEELNMFAFDNAKKLLKLDI